MTNNHCNVPLFYLPLFTDSCIRYKGEEDLRKEDGGSDECGHVEASLTVCVLLMSLMHFTPTVLTTAAHTETQPHQWHQQHKQQPQYSKDYKADLIVDRLQRKRREKQYNCTNNSLL